MADQPGSKFNFKRPPAGPSSKKSSSGESGGSRFTKPGIKKPASNGAGGSRFAKPGAAASSGTEAKKITKPGFSFKKPEESKPSLDKKFVKQPKAATPTRQAEEKEAAQPEKQPIKRKWNFGPKTLKKESPPKTETDQTKAEPKEAAQETEPAPAAVKETAEKKETPEKKPEKEEHEPPEVPQVQPPTEPAEKAVREVNISELVSSQAEKAEKCAAPFAPLEEKPPSPFGGSLDIFQRNKLQAQTPAPADISPDLHYRDQIEIWAQRFKDDLDKMVDAYAGNLILELDKVFSGVKVPSSPSSKIDTEEIKKRVASAEEFIEEELKAPEQKGFMAFMKKAKEEAEKLREREKKLKK